MSLSPEVRNTALAVGAVGTVATSLYFLSDKAYVVRALGRKPNVYYTPPTIDGSDSDGDGPGGNPPPPTEGADSNGASEMVASAMPYIFAGLLVVAVASTVAWVLSSRRAAHA